MIDNSNPQRPAKLFNEYQIRRVKIVLWGFEEDLRMALRCLDGEQDEGYMYQRKLMLSEELREEARRYILEGLEEIHRLADTLDFEPEVENASRVLMGRLNIDWEYLSNLHAKDLKGYGVIHPELSNILDESAERMSRIALDLGNIFMQGSAGIDDND
jgi:hypothetical protein